MRRTLLLIMLCCLALAALAQGPLVLSDSILAVRITDPARQVTTFAPVLTMLKELQAMQPAANPPVKAQPTPEEFAKIISAIPGAEAKGEVWIVSMAPTKPAQKAPAGGEGAVKLDPPRGNSYLLLPLADQAAFAKFLQAEAASGKADAARGLALGNTGLLVLDGALPAYNAVQFDLPVKTKREVAFSLKIASAQSVLDMFNAGEMAAFLLPAIGVLDEMQQNQQRMECGLAMQGEDLSLEFFSQARQDSPLAKALVAAKQEPPAAELAAYLPDNLAYCGAGAPMLPGAPGTAHVLLRFGSGMLLSFMPPEIQKPIGTNLDALLAQCRGGRVVGVTTPPAGKPDDASVIAIYRVKTAEARTAMRGFAQEMQNLSEMMAVAGQGGTQFAFTPNAEQIGDVPVDLLAINITPQQKTQEMRDGMALGDLVQVPPIAKADVRIAYVNNLMLLAAGPAGSRQLSGIIERVKNNKAGFTAGARYAKLKETLPATARGFESLSTIDLCRVFIGQFPENQRKEALMFLSLFPPQRTLISSYQEITDGTLHGELRLPQEQLQFVYSLLRVMAESKGQANGGGEQPQ